MRVLFISHEDSKFGAPKSLMELMKTLKYFYKVEPVVLLHSKDDVYRMCEKEGIEKHVIGHRNCITKKPTNFAMLLRSIAKRIIYKFSKHHALKVIRNEVNINSIDIIHTNVSIVDIGLELNKKYKIPHIIHLREPASIIDNYLFCCRNYISMLNNYTTKAIAISKYIKTEWVKKGLNETSIETIYNGLELSSINESHHISKKIKIVFCGSLSREKRQHELIDAIHLLPEVLISNINVDFIGRGEQKYQKFLSDKISKYGLEKTIHLKGYIENIPQHLSKYDVGVNSSSGEPFGRVTVEYMAAGLCVIASNKGASPEIIDNNITGYLYNDINDLSAILVKLITDKDLIIKTGKNARDIVMKKFNTKENAKNIYSLYCNVIKQNLVKNNKILD